MVARLGLEDNFKKKRIKNQYGYFLLATVQEKGLILYIHWQEMRILFYDFGSGGKDLLELKN